MRECCEADVRRVTLEARETDERPDLYDLVRVEGGGARGGRMGSGLTYVGALVPVRYATSPSVLDKVDEGVSLRTKRCASLTDSHSRLTTLPHVVVVINSLLASSLSSRPVKTEVAEKADLSGKSRRTRGGRTENVER